MDTDLLAWLATFEALDEVDNTLLCALLSDSPCGRFGIVDDLDAREQRLLTVDEVSPAHGPHAGGFVSDGAAVESPGSSTTTVEDAQQVPAHKQKKRSTWRAKDEIERLRRSVVDLEALIALRSHRRPDSRGFAIQESKPLSGDVAGVWKSVAVRQLRRLRESLHENQKLRVHVQHQLEMSKGLARLVQRARRGIPSRAIPRNPTPLDEAMFVLKRQEVVAAVGAIFQCLEGVTNDTFIPVSRGEYRVTRTFAKCSDLNVEPGALLVRSRARRLVPVELSLLGDQFWGHLQDADLGGSQLALQHMERSAQLHLAVQSFEVPTENGPALFRVIGARARFLSDSRDITVAAGSLWPDAFAPADVKSVGFDQRSWTIAQPYAASAGLSEVLCHSECFRSVTPNSSHSVSLTPPQAAVMLDDLVAATQAFALDEINQVIDGVLINSTKLQS